MIPPKKQYEERTCLFLLFTQCMTFENSQLSLKKFHVSFRPSQRANKRGILSGWFYRFWRQNEERERRVKRRIEGEVEVEKKMEEDRAIRRKRESNHQPRAPLTPRRDRRQNGGVKIKETHAIARVGHDITRFQGGIIELNWTPSSRGRDCDRSHARKPAALNRAASNWATESISRVFWLFLGAFHPRLHNRPICKSDCV